MWWSASHTGGCIAAARCRVPVGIDVQLHVRRPAAMRWLARTAQLDFEPTVAHWSAAAAYWKASGNAWRRPAPGELFLPRSLPAGWSNQAFNGQRKLPVFVQDTAAMAIAVVLYCNENTAMRTAPGET
jgi:hypothetical protein